MSMHKRDIDQLMEIEEIWGKAANSCIGSKIADIEVAPIVQSLRLKLENKMTIDLSGGWRYRNNKSLLIGAMDIGFYLQAAEDEDEFNKLMEEDEKHHFKKVKSLIGKELKSVEFGVSEVLFTFSGNRYLDWLCLSRDEVGFSIVESRDSMHA